MDKRIGVFDSGLGGLTVLTELINVMPNESFYVFGDTKNMPYGIRESEDIRDLTVNAFNKLEELGIKAFVIACNTATVHGIEKLKEITDIPVVGVIEPGVLSALEKGCKNILVLATEATINSGLIQKMLKDYNPDLTVEGIGAPEMVLAVENGLANTEEGRKIVYSYLKKSTIEPDCVMLSCTHFPALENFIVDYYKEEGRDITIVNPARKCAEIIKEELEKNKDLKTNGQQEIDYFTSGDVNKYIQGGNSLLAGKVTIDTANKL